MSAPGAIWPDAVLLPDGAVAERVIELEGDRVAAVRPPDAAVDVAAERLHGQLVVPGLVDAHSHAFQLALRGRVERVGDAAQDDFWSWREAMYAEAGALDAESIGRVSRACFGEARAAGYTAIGEFHYVHHRPDGTPYEEPNALALAVIEAARAVGVRIALLMTAYARAGAGREPEPRQRRFCDPSVEAYLARVDALADALAGDPLVGVGYAPHSVRAVPRDWLERIAAAAAADGRVVHVHADEQVREIAECEAEHGCRPIELLDRCGLLGPRTTVVHATHADAHELDLLAERGAGVCACPTTEANLGDGFLPAAELWQRAVPVCFGSDSNVRLDPFEEARETEGCARRLAQRRNVLVAAGDDGPAPSLWHCLTRNGARALGIDEPRIAAGAPADLVAIDRRTLGDDASLAAAALFAGSAGLVTATWVAGRRSP